MIFLGSIFYTLESYQLCRVDIQMRKDLKFLDALDMISFFQA